MRTLKDPLNFIMLIAFPLAMVSIMVAAFNAELPASVEYLLGGFNPSATGNLTFNAIFFLFFSGMIVTDYLYAEFRSDMRWRLMATPKRFSSFVSAAIIASMIVTLINAVIVLTFGRFVLNAHLHNIFITGATVFVMAIFVTLFGVLIFLLVPKKSTCTAVMMAFAFIQMLPIQFGILDIERGVIGIANFVPVVAAVQALQYSGTKVLNFEDGAVVGLFEPDMNRALIHLGIVVGYTVVLGIAVAVLGKVRKI